jgi:pimeloyl-ACP methyl ester carboxylesterase
MALHLALERPELLCALGLLAPAVDQLTPPVKEILLKRLEVRDRRSARVFLRRVFHRAPWLVLLSSPQLVLTFETASTRSNLDEFREIDLLKPEKLAQLSVPTLLLWGEKEKLLPPESLEFFRAHLPPLAQLEVVPGFSHIPQVERPAEVAERMERFADQLGLE